MGMAAQQDMWSVGVGARIACVGHVHVWGQGTPEGIRPPSCVGDSRGHAGDGDGPRRKLVARREVKHGDGRDRREEHGEESTARRARRRR